MAKDVKILYDVAVKNQWNSVTYFNPNLPQVGIVTSISNLEYRLDIANYPFLKSYGI